jgi:hypothetical protein
LKIGILWQVGGSQLWYVLSALVFWLIGYIKQRSLRKEELPEGATLTENVSKAIVLFTLIMAILFGPILIAVLFLSKC